MRRTGLGCERQQRHADPELIAEPSERTRTAVFQAGLGFLPRAGEAQRGRQKAVDGGESTGGAGSGSLLSVSEGEGKLVAEPGRKPGNGESAIPVGRADP